METVTYGTNNASFLSTRCLIELANLEKESFPLASRALTKQCYVDDIHGCDSLDELMSCHQQLTELLKTVGIQLHK